MKKLDTAGRIMIPKEIRERNGYKTNDIFEIYEHNDEIVLRPLKLNYSINELEMSTIRKVYSMIKDTDLLEDSELAILKEASKCTDLACPKCNEPLYLTSDNNYKCIKCGE